MELAERIYNLLSALDFYEIQDTGTTPEDITEQIREQPQEVIRYLVDLLENLAD